MKFMGFSFSILASALFMSACVPSAPEEPEGKLPDTDLEIKEFSLREYPGLDIKIDNEAHTIDVEFPFGAILGNAHIVYSVAEGVTGNPESGSSIDLNEENAIYLSDEEGNARKYILNVSVLPSSDIVLREIVNNEYSVRGTVTGNVISFVFPFGADITDLTFSADTYQGTKFEPDLSSSFDLTENMRLTVTAPDGVTSKEFTMEATISEASVAVRGVYLPSPSHTSSFITYENAEKSLDLMADLNFNCLFVCVWAASKVAWNSDVLMENSSYTDYAQGNMYASYSGGTGDALRDIIALAHERDIKVVLWFEYGFMHKTGGVDFSDPVLAEHPEWIGIGNDGNYSNYNGTDYYMNAYDTEVQDFILALMKEALSKYPDIDGIQGDDRLPAMPRNSGYDDKTAALYKAEKGIEPPADFNESGWVDWRLEKLNAFAGRMYSELKSIKPGLCVCSAPNKYPWCEQNLMQDWPSWIEDGVVDLLTVQFYVLPTYENDVRNAMEYVRQKTDRNILNPAMILNNGGRIMEKDVLIEQLQFNRETGTCGESQFWFDGLYVDYVKEVFRQFYFGKAVFPEF